MAIGTYQQHSASSEKTSKILELSQKNIELSQENQMIVEKSRDSITTHINKKLEDFGIRYDASQQRVEKIIKDGVDNFEPEQKRKKIESLKKEPFPSQHLNIIGDLLSSDLDPTYFHELKSLLVKYSKYNFSSSAVEMEMCYLDILTLIAAKYPNQTIFDKDSREQLFFGSNLSHICISGDTRFNHLSTFEIVPIIKAFCSFISIYSKDYSEYRREIFLLLKAIAAQDNWIELTEYLCSELPKARKKEFYDLVKNDNDVKSGYGLRLVQELHSCING